MLDEAHMTPSLLREQHLRQAALLDRAARRRAEAQDAAVAVTLCWGADLVVLQGALVRQLLIDGRAPQRQYFAALERIAAGVAQPQEPAASAADLVRATRAALAGGLDDAVATDVNDRLVDVTFLEELGAPTHAEFAALVERRLQGHSTADFVHERYREAREFLVHAHAEHLGGDDASAIQTAYQGDVRCLEGYLVESAVAVGDAGLLTVTVRWELAVMAMEELAGLPADFAAAVGAIRDAIAHALGEPDASRFRRVLPGL